MMYLFGGDDVDSSRKAFSDAVSSVRLGEIRRFDGKSLTLETLTTALESQSLFGGDFVVVIEKFFSGRTARSKNTDMLVDALKEASKEVDIFLWEDKEITPGAVKKFGTSVKNASYMLPMSLFALLDSVGTATAAKTLQLYEQTLKTHAPEVILALLSSRVRQLMMCLSHEVPLGMLSWQLSKLTSQSQSFTMDKLISMYKSLYILDRDNKSGLSPICLASRIRIWFCTNW